MAGIARGSDAHFQLEGILLSLFRFSEFPVIQRSGRIKLLDLFLQRTLNGSLQGNLLEGVNRKGPQHPGHQHQQNR